MDFSRRVPKEEKYFQLFCALAGKAAESSEIFVSENHIEAKAEALKALEHNADGIVHEITDMLKGHQDPPLRREDIHNLAVTLDRVIDDIEEAADRIMRFRLTYEYTFLRFGYLLSSATSAIQRGCILLKRIGKNYKELQEVCIKINDLEHEGDMLHRNFLLDLDEQNKEAFLEKRIFYRLIIGDLLENSLDACEDVADLLDKIASKNC